METLVNLINVSRSFIDLFEVVILLLITFTFLVFFWGFVKYAKNISEGSSEVYKEYKSYMIWSMVAIFVLTSFWGIIYLLKEVFFDSDRVADDIQTFSLTPSNYQNYQAEPTPITGTLPDSTAITGTLPLSPPITGTLPDPSTQ